MRRVIREWFALPSGEPYYVDVTILDEWPHLEAHWFYLDARKRQYHKEKYRRREGGGFEPQHLRGFAQAAGSMGRMEREILGILDRAGLTSSVVEHSLRKRKVGGSTPPSGSLFMELSNYAKDFFTEVYPP